MQRLPRQAAFAKELPGSDDADDSFLPDVVDDGELDLSLLEKEQRVGRIPLDEDALPPGNPQDLLAGTDLVEKGLWIKSGEVRTRHSTHPG